MAATTRPNLAVELPNDTDIRLTRSFAAPRELVFDAFTRPEHVVHWLTGPDGWHYELCEADLRVGGSWRYVWAGPEGSRLASRGVYREVNRPARVVSEDVFDDFSSYGMPVMPWPASVEGEAVSAITFDEQHGATSFVQVLRYKSREARDAALATGMEQGMAAGFDRLDGYLANIAAGSERD